MRRIETLFRQHWTEKMPEPLEMTDTEILDWVAEYCEHVSYTRPTSEYRGGFFVDVPGISPSRGESLREAVCLAAAKLKSANE